MKLKGTLLILLILIFLIGLLGCNSIQKNKNFTSPCNKDEIAHQKLIEPTISKKVAVLIAREWVSKDIDIVYYKEEVSEKEETWIIAFVFKEKYKHLIGGEAVVEVDKTSGEVVNWVLAK